MQKSTFLLLSLLLFISTSTQAQNWVNGGNTLSGNGTIGTNSNYSLIFKTYDTERGRITNTGLWGIGTGTTITPNAKLHINSLSTEDPLRVMVNGNTKLFVHRSGGVSIGSTATPPSNGLYVSGNVGMGTTTPEQKLHVVGNEILSTGFQSGFKFRNRGSASSADDWVWYSQDNVARLWRAGSGDLLNITTGGNVGIGTTTPSLGYKLHVVNSATGFYTGAVYGKGQTGVLAQSEGVDGFGVYASATGSGSYGIYTRSQYSHGIYATTGSSSSFAGYFSGNVFTTASYQPSDEKLKQNITDVGNATAIINRLKPKNYEYKTEGKFGKMNLPPGQQFGFLSQELEQVLPGLVKQVHHTEKQSLSKDAAASGQESKEEVVGFKAVNYTGLIPVMVKAMQEQQATIQQLQQSKQEQDAKIAELTQMVQRLSQKSNIPIEPTATFLSYSAPNPSSTSTRINYNIPENTTKAELVLTNVTGQQIKRIPLNSTGQVDINTSAFSSGTYFYSLYLDGSLFQTRKMMVNR